MASGWLYYIAAFFAIATQAVWSANYLTLERLDTAVAIYVAFGLVSLGVPVVARRMSRPLLPAWGGGVVLLLGLCLLFFVSLGPVAPAALWALALLLAITNAALFIESAAGRLPTRLAGWQPSVVGPDDDLVGASRRKRRRPAIAHGRGRADARHARRPRVVGAQRGRATARRRRRRSRAGCIWGSSVISSCCSSRWIAPGRYRHGRCLRHSRRSRWRRAPLRSGAASPPCIRPGRLLQPRW